MAGYEFTVVSWRGVTAVADGTNYLARAIVDNDVFSGAQATPIESQEPGRSPTHVRTQPQGDTFLIEAVMLGNFTQAALDTLKKYWSPLEQTADYLVFTPEGGGGNRRILGVVESFEKVDTNLFHIMFRTASGYQEAATATADSHTLTASGQTDALVNDGNLKTYPTFTITPGTVMADTSAQIKRRRAHVANRSESNFSDPVGTGWPIDLGEDAWDTATLQAAGKVLSSLNDVRVILKGREIYCWKDPATSNATTKLWTNLTMRGRKTATLAAAINNSVTTLTVNNSSLLQGWPPTGFFLLNSERIQYTARTSSTMTIVRGSGNTTAASHAAGDTLYWVEHAFLDVIYDYASAGDPLPPDDQKPRIDLADSTNSSFKWTSAFLNAGDRRSAAWQPLWVDDGFTSDYITLSTVGGNLQFKDILPTAERPNYNNIYIDFPVPALGSFTFDEIVQWNMLLHVYGIDFLGGKERLLESYEQDNLAAHATQTLSLSLGTSRLRLNGRIGSVTGYRLDSGATGGSTLLEGNPNDTGISASFLLEKPTRITNFVARLGRAATYAGLITARLYADGGDAPDTERPESDTFLNATATGSIDIYPDTTNVVFTPDHVLHLPAGRHHFVLVFTVAGDEFDVIWSAVRDRVHPNIWMVVYGYETPGDPESEQYVNILYEETPLFTVLTDETEAQSDAPVETEDVISLNDLTVPFDTSRTPKIVFAPEEVCYLLNTRITNSTTGAYLDIGPHPMKLSNSIVIDCAAKTVTDSETGTQIPFILHASDPSEWLYLAPGSNTITFTETGVVSTAYAHSFRSRWL